MYYAYEVTLMADYHVDGIKKADEIKVALREYFTNDQMKRMTFDAFGRLMRFWCPTELTPEQMFIVETITGLNYREAGSARSSEP
ncbi:hypothetical protein ES703_02117 [subsurface metagenome]